MSSPIVFTDESHFSLDFSSDYTITPPLVFNSSGDQVGVTVNIGGDNYEINYMSGYYGLIVITIPSHTLILIDEDGVKTSNDTVIEATTFRSIPNIGFSFPSTLPLIDFENGIHVYVNLERAPAMELPLILDNTFPVYVETSEHLVYVSSLNKIFFVPTSNDNYSEWFKIIPSGDISNLLNKTYGLIISSSPYNIVPPIGSNYGYTTINTVLPLAILNPEFTNTLVDDIWRRNTIYIMCEVNPKDIYTFNIYSADGDPTFELTNHMDAFEISSSGVLRSKGFVHSGPMVYDLIVVIRNRLEEVINAHFRVTCYDIFSDFYFQSFMDDISSLRKLSISVAVCENSISLFNKEVRNLSQAVYMIIQVLNYMIQESITLNFIADASDVSNLGNILVYGTQTEFLFFLLSKLPGTLPESLLSTKLIVLTDKLFVFFKNFLKAFIMNPSRENTYRIDTLYGNIIIKKW